MVVLTNGTLSFGGQETLDQAYAALARALVSGHLDVTRAVIGNEGFYVDGKVYLYYGILPALLRVPFLILSGIWLPGPRLFVLAEAILSALLVHLTVFHVLTSRRPARLGPQISITLLSGAIGWLASPAYLLVSNASIYNEPFGCALVLTATVFYLLRDALADALSGSFPRISGPRLALVGLASALCLQARPPMAVALFALTGMLCLSTAFERDAGATPSRRIAHLLRKSLLPGLFLTASVIGFLWLNWLRFGGPFSSGPITHYGYYLFFEGASDRVGAFMDHGRFDLRRTVPNAIVNFTGIAWLHSALCQLLGTGKIRLEGPLIGVLLLWMLPCTYAVFGLRAMSTVLGRARWPGLWLTGVTVCMALSTLIILSYATVTLRYKSEIWPLIFVLALFGLHDQTGVSAGPFRLRANNERATASGLASPVVWAMLGVSILASTAAVVGLKANPFFNGHPRSVFENRLHPDLPGS